MRVDLESPRAGNKIFDKCCSKWFLSSILMRAEREALITKAGMQNLSRGLLLGDGGVQPPCQLFTVILFLGLQVSICFFSHVVCHVILYCFTHDIEGPYTAMRMSSTANSWISEMVMVGPCGPAAPFIVLFLDMRNVVSSHFLTVCTVQISVLVLATKRTSMEGHNLYVTSVCNRWGVGMY